MASAGQTVDRVETQFGIRTVAFDAAKGFILNGKPYLLKGTCNHQDHAGVGAALPDRLQYFRIARFPEYGKLSKKDFSGITDGARIDVLAPHAYLAAQNELALVRREFR